MNFSKYFKKGYYTVYKIDKYIVACIVFTILLFAIPLMSTNWVVQLASVLLAVIFAFPPFIYLIFQHQTYELTTTFLKVDLKKRTVELLTEGRNYSNGEHIYRFIFLSDLHLNPFVPEKFNRNLVKKVNSLRPDFLLFGGDYMPDYKVSLDVLQLIKGFKAKEKIAVLGNHDYSLLERKSIKPIKISGFNERSGMSVKDKLESLGVQVLMNENYKFMLKNDLAINIFGMDSDWTWKAEPGKYNPKHSKSGNKVLNIIMSHEPSMFENWNFPGAFLVLSGHNHGGQLRLTKTINIYSMARFFPKKFKEFIKNGYGFYADDLYENKYGLKMYCSRGIGLTDIALRINCRPEITVIDVG